MTKYRKRWIPLHVYVREVFKKERKGMAPFDVFEIVKEKFPKKRMGKIKIACTKMYGKNEKMG